MSEPQHRSNLVAVVALRERGWYVFPVWWPLPNGACACDDTTCEDVGKHPMGRLVPHGLKDASNLEAVIRGWWKQFPYANIGVRTGSPSAIVVLDVDSHAGGDESLASLQTVHGVLPQTLESRTGGGGRHLFFAHPGTPVANKVAIAPGLDLRGDGGYIVAPPSLHGSGQQYTWVDPEQTLAPFPQWLLEELAKCETGLSANHEPLDIAAALQGVPQGQRDDTLFRLACKFRWADIPQDTAERLMLEAAANCQPPFPIDQARRKVQDAYRKYPSGPNPDPTPKSELPTIGNSVGTELLEVAGDELAAAGSAGPQDLPGLPLLGELGYIILNWSHLLAGYPRTGKTELITRLIQEWLSLGYQVLYLTEEPKSIWECRLSRLEGEWERLRVVFGLGEDPERLFKRGFDGPEQVVIVDTLRNLLRLEDETNNSEVARVLNPWVAQARKREKTLLMAHHMRKGAGAHGEGIAGGHALLGVFDVALELVRDDNRAHRRLIRSYARLIAPPELAYERTEDGQYRALGDPAALRLAEVQGRVCQCLDPQDWKPTKDIWTSLGDPRPSEEQVRQALLALAGSGKVDRDPPLGQNARGKTHRWRLQTSLPTESPMVGSSLSPVGDGSKGNGEIQPSRTRLTEADLPWVRSHLGCPIWGGKS